LKEMRCVLLALFFVAAFGAMPFTPTEFHAKLKTLVQKPSQFLQEKFMTLDTNPLASSLCNASYFSDLIPGGQIGIGVNGACPCFTFDFAGLFNCYGGFCNSLNACPTLFDIIPEGSTAGEACPIDSIATNCANGCFGRVIAPLLAIDQCVINWAVGTLNNLCNFIGANSGGQLTAAQCLQEFGGSGFLDSFTGNSNFDVLTNSFDELCYEQPATGNLCYGWLTGAYGGDSSLWTSSCPYLEAMGCCAGAIKSQLKFFNYTLTSAGPCTSNLLTSDDYGIFKSALSSCGLSSTPSCPAPGQTVQYVLGKFALDGISFSAFWALTVEERWPFYTALRADISANLGLTGVQVVWVTVANITVTSTAGEIILTFTVRADTDANTATVQATITTFLTGSTTATFTNTNSYITSNPSLGSGGSGVTLNRGGSSAATQTQSGASSDAAARTVSFVMVLFAVIVAMFRF